MTPTRTTTPATTAPTTTAPATAAPAIGETTTIAARARRGAATAPWGAAWRRLLAVAVALLAGTTGGLAVTGVAPSPAAAHGEDANGCTGVPDTGHGFRFHSICDRHDRCYGGRPYGDGSSGRAACDRVFRDEMLRYCERHRRFSTEGLTCRAVARTYHLGVRLLGEPFFRRAAPTPIA